MGRRKKQKRERVEERKCIRQEKEDIGEIATTERKGHMSAHAEVFLLHYEEIYSSQWVLSCCPLSVQRFARKLKLRHKTDSIFRYRQISFKNGEKKYYSAKEVNVLR